MFVADLLRHGELLGGIKYRGHIEGKLSSKGLRQMDDVWKKICHDIDLIISSPLSRCADPAQRWAKQKNIPCIIDARIIEMHYGQWEGLSHDDIEAAFPGSLQQWREDPTGMRPPDGESPEELQVRVVGFWQDICRTYKGKRACIVGHSGSIRMLIAHIQQQSIAHTRNIDMPYACWSRAEHQHEQSKMLFIHKTSSCSHA
ncbi:MAG: histidine phosphatase family protein [Mariprofundaceae bacterium]|nr:histidine phosphatase family protein [Mariprofundaceae bacterium]